VSLSGVAEVVQRIAAPGALSDLPDCPPIGVAAKVSSLGVEGRLVVAAETLEAVGDAVAKARGAVAR
jgi:hypothetical protein